MNQLHWLPDHSDLNTALKEAKSLASAEEQLQAACTLSGYRRDFTAAGRIDKLATNALKGCDAKAAGLSKLKVAVLSSHSIEHLMPATRVAGLGRKLSIEFYIAPYGMYRQALLLENASLTDFAPQVIVLALDANDTPVQVPFDATESDVEAAIDARIEEIRILWRCAKERYAATVIQQTLVSAQPSVFGSYEALVPGAPHSVVSRLNDAIRKAAREDGVLLMDVAWQALQGMYYGGIAEPVRWHQAKQLISPVFAPTYGDQLARVLAASIGLARKCLVLDLDNTLWGGVIGDDGPSGIQIGQGTATGEAFLAFQLYASQLARRGIILAVCSKNDLTVAEAAFEHPEMLLKRSDIAAFVANWDDKATNLRRIATMLNIGLDSLVFADDNPAEREIIRRELPEVAVPELPEDIADYPACVAAGGYFETSSFTSDDVNRGRNYKLNADRAQAMTQVTDMEGYLRGLEMKLTVSRIAESELSRSTQLLNKTNQFNLTTRRYTEAEVLKIASDSTSVALALRLQDKFGDNGLISVILARRSPALSSRELLIDSWLMSCRVLGRQVEAAALQALVDQCRALGYSALMGEYRPTDKNSMVAEHYKKLGFEEVLTPEGADPDSTFWRLDLSINNNSTHYIQVTAA
ncbi:methoxymalonyl-ACP biosynthesis protein [Pseudomonas oryzihabitans]|uniref:HAD-IIIC family phosphatase n=1 Tax=Pseudomonas oryzihabitans TaxID=47885 RepID=UPI0007376939|nr:HAD-IIIC family phosphatase [Pseudomonas psychrotolerans]KTT49553.1 methoxymalonyl-ACP biosynthesis protein [Pseudomonas psychrotolerans]